VIYCLKTRFFSEIFSPRPIRILRLVANRQLRPFSIRSMVKGEMPAMRANSALLSILASRIFLTLFFASILHPFLQSFSGGVPIVNQFTGGCQTN
jgi:predicted nucleic acid-binding protein